jgi:uncharacterized protein YbaR (Trm112 family)
VSGVIESVWRYCLRVGRAVLEPLRTGDGPNKFRLSSAETATTTHDGDSGWARRPPATVACPRCTGDILQHNARDRIDCPRCVAEFDHEEFPALELRGMICPVCKNDMDYGQRHPDQFDFPEWATCNECRYHWEFRHSY